MTPFRDRNFDSSEFQSGPFNGRRTRLFRRCEILFAKFHNHRALCFRETACSGTRELDRRMKPSALVSRYRVIIRWKRTLEWKRAKRCKINEASCARVLVSMLGSLFFLEVSHLDATTERNVCIVLFLFHRMETGSGSLPASPADSGVSDVESSTSSGGNEDANLLLKARLNPNSSLQPSLASHHSHLSSGKRIRISYVQLSYYGVSSCNDLVRPIFSLGLV